MSAVDQFSAAYAFNRQRTLALLDAVEQLPKPAEALAFRPGPGRAHIGWQLVHTAITEEIFATERLSPAKPPKWTDLWPRFRGGSTPDDDVPPASFIRQLLAESRQRLLATLAEYPDSRLGEIPAAMAQRKLTVQDVLYLLGWHEAHHQGQAHITLNLYKAAHV